MPRDIDTRLLFYRKDLYMKHLGHTQGPETWDELVHNSLVIQTAERALGHEMWGFPISMAGNRLDPLQAFVPFYLSWGSSLLNQTSGCNFESPRFKDALQFFTGMYNNQSQQIVPTADIVDDIGPHVSAVEMFINGWPQAIHNAYRL